MLRETIAPSFASPEMSEPHSSESSLRISDQPLDSPAASLTPQPFELNDLTATVDSLPTTPDEVLGEVELDMRIELGRTRMRLEDVLQLRVGSVVTLDNAANDPVDVYVNDRLIARGEIMVMDDRFCVRVTELVGSV